MLSLVVQCIVIGPVCGCVCNGRVGGRRFCVYVWVCGSVTTITQNPCIDPHQNGFVGKGSDHIQLIKFWPPRAPGRGLRRGENF